MASCDKCELPMFHVQILLGEKKIDNLKDH